MQSIQCAYKSCINHTNTSQLDKKHPCAYCNQAFYCSISCRILDWESSHKRTCPKAPPQTGPDLTFEPKPLSVTSISILSNNSGKSFSDYELINRDNKLIAGLLGKGSFGQVKLARDKLDPTQLFALKILNKKHLQLNAGMEFLKREINIQKSLSHPHIITLYHAFEDNESVYLVLEYAENGNLFTYLRKKRKLTENEAFIYFFQTCLGIDYLHKRGILHRDLKPENLLLDKKMNIKLCDFGYSAEDLGQRNTFCGTVDYMPPEVVLKRTHNSKVDIWSLGILLFELLHGYPPFKGFTNEEKFKSIVKNQIQCEEISEEAKDLIRRLLRSEPSVRLDFTEIFEHPWLKKFESHFNINMKSLIYQPENDISSPLNKRQSPTNTNSRQKNASNNNSPSGNSKKSQDLSPSNGRSNIASQPPPKASQQKSHQTEINREKSQERKKRILQRVGSEADNSKILSQSPNTSKSPKYQNQMNTQSPGKEFHSPKFNEEYKQESEKVSRSLSANKIQNNSSGYSTPSQSPKISKVENKNSPSFSLAKGFNQMKGKYQEYSPENFESEKPRSSRGRLELTQQQPANPKDLKPSFIVNRNRILQDLYEEDLKSGSASNSKTDIKGALKYSQSHRSDGDEGQKGRKLGKRIQIIKSQRDRESREELLDSFKTKVASLYSLNENSDVSPGHVERQILSNYNKEKGEYVARGAKSARDGDQRSESSLNRANTERKLHRKHVSMSDSKRSSSKHKSKGRHKKSEMLTEITEDLDLEDARVSRPSFKNMRQIPQSKEKPQPQLGFFSRLSLLCGCVGRDDKKSGNTSYSKY